jgi:hypothetical protein
VKVHIEQDEDPVSPREDDNIGTMFSLDPNHRFGDSNGEFYRAGYGVSWCDIEKVIIENEGPGFGFALHRDGRVNVWIDPETSAEETGIAGVIYVSAEEAIYEFGNDLSAAEMFQRVKSCCEAEVAAYVQYLEGDVWGFIVEDEDTGEHLDSCWGFFGREYCEEEAQRALEYQQECAVEAKKRTERAVRDAPAY